MATRRGGATTPRIKNYTTELSEAAIFEAIRKTLASHGAKRITFDYDDQGKATAIEFVVEVGGVPCSFHLPARFKEAEPLVAKARKAARMAASGEALLIDVGSSSLEEVFLPYLVVEEGKTLFEQFAERRALPPPSSHTIIAEE